MQAVVTWGHGLSFQGTADTGFSLPLGADPSVGGDNDGFRPMELFAIGLAGCTGMDVISILQKKRQDIQRFEVRVSAEQREEFPRIFTKLHVHYDIHGTAVQAEAAERAIELSETKYCPAQAMLRMAAEITSSYQIHEA